MLESLPENLQASITEKLSEFYGQACTLKSFTFRSGGCINNTGILSSSKGDLFLKWNSKARFHDLFEKEAKGLSLLKSNCKSLNIPEVICLGEDAQHIYIILENIESAPSSVNFWENLGKGMAQLHSIQQGYFGFSEDNYIGSLVQKNSPEDNWLDFFIKNRLEFPFKMAFDRGLVNSKHKTQLDTLCQHLPSLMPDKIDSSLLHGDLWSGNILVDKFGQPCLIDPAVYFGFREVEIAFSQLFGRFGERFYSAYNEVNALDDGFNERIDLWNLNPILVHINLFGSSYLHSFESILKKFN